MNKDWKLIICTSYVFLLSPPHLFPCFFSSLPLKLYPFFMSFSPPHNIPFYMSLFFPFRHYPFLNVPFILTSDTIPFFRHFPPPSQALSLFTCPFFLPTSDTIPFLHVPFLPLFFFSGAFPPTSHTFPFYWSLFFPPQILSLLCALLPPPRLWFDLHFHCLVLILSTSDTISLMCSSPPPPDIIPLTSLFSPFISYSFLLPLRHYPSYLSFFSSSDSISLDSEKSGFFYSIIELWSWPKQKKNSLEKIVKFLRLFSFCWPCLKSISILPLNQVI